MKDFDKFILDEYDDEGTDFDFGTVLEQEDIVKDHDQNDGCAKRFNSHGKRIKTLEDAHLRESAKTRLLLGIVSVFGAALIMIGWDITKGLHSMAIQQAKLVAQVKAIEQRISK